VRVHQPRHHDPGQLDALGVGRRRVGGRSRPADHPLVDVQDGVGDDGAGAVADDEGTGGEALRHACRR
jgi:hypothetical protein